MDNDGNRILAKYYDKKVFPSVKEQNIFEKKLFNKTSRGNAENIVLDGLACVYKNNVDLFFYVSCVHTWKWTNFGIGAELSV